MAHILSAVAGRSNSFHRRNGNEMQIRFILEKKDASHVTI